MRVNPLAFNHRKAYLIGFSEPADGLCQLEQVDSHIEAAKTGLLTWGFLEEEVHVYRDQDMLPDFDVDEQSTIQTLGQDGKTLVYLYFKGHGQVAGRGQPFTGCLQGVNSMGTYNLEAFLANIARDRNTHTIGFFDCCRRKKADCEMAFNPVLQSGDNIAVLYRETAVVSEPGECSCTNGDEEKASEPLIARFFQHLEKEQRKRDE